MYVIHMDMYRHWQLSTALDSENTTLLIQDLLLY